MCPKCNNEIGDEKHLFTKCEKLSDIKSKYDINDPNKGVYRRTINRKNDING